jgi:hypothetical protein
MMLITVLQEILEVIVVIGHLLEGKVLTEGLSHVEDLAILSLILFQQGSIDLVELWHLGDCSHAHIGISELISHRVMLHIQGF